MPPREETAVVQRHPLDWVLRVPYPPTDSQIRAVTTSTRLPTVSTMHHLTPAQEDPIDRLAPQAAVALLAGHRASKDPVATARLIRRG